MNKNNLKHIIEEYGKPNYVTIDKYSQHHFDQDYTVRISWNKKTNQEIIERKMMGNKPYIVKWEARQPITLKHFRHNGAKTSAKERAQQLSYKIKQWIKEISNKGQNNE